MKLYLLRHGIAEEYGIGKPDSLRELTQGGIEQMVRLVHYYHRMGFKLDLILSSPYARALKTAQIVAEGLGQANILEVDDRIASGFCLGDLQLICKERPQIQRLMVVGHNPDLPIIAGQLTGGSSIEMKKAGLIRIDAARIEPGEGVLEWIVPPGILV